MDLREDTYFIGRSEELIKVVKNLQNGIHTLLTGDKGVGKSRLLIETMRVLNGSARHIYFSNNDQPRTKIDSKIIINPDAYHILYVKYFTPLSIALKLTITELYGIRLLIMNEEQVECESVRQCQYIKVST